MVSKFAKKLFRPRHDYVPGTQIFSAIDVDRIKDELELDKKGREDGERESPASDAESYSSAELQIQRKAVNWRGTALEEARRALEVYIDRVKRSSEGLEIARLRTLAQNAETDLKQVKNDETARLVDSEREVRRRTEDFRVFKERQKPWRHPHHPLNFWKAFSVVAIVALFEIVANTYFFVEAGNELGYLGAALEAVLIPAINITACWLITFWGVRQLWRRELFKKILGLLGLAAFLGFAITFNLCVAHFRDALSTIEGTSGAHGAALESLTTRPFELESVMSWVLFGIGFTVSCVTMVDALAYRDPIPGYWKYEEYRKRALDAYNEHRLEAVENLKSAFDEHEAELIATRKNLASAQAKALEIEQRVEHLQADLTDFGKYIQNTVDELAALYRERNISARKTAKPALFNKAVWELEPLEIDAKVATLKSQVDLLRDTTDGKDILETGLKDLNTALEESLEEVRRLQDFEKVESDH